MNENEIQRIAECLLFLRDNQRYEADRDTSALILEKANAISADNARRIGCEDILMRLKRNALALCNLQDMLISCIDNMQSEIRSYIEAQNGEYYRQNERAEQLRKISHMQKLAQQARARRQKNNV